MPKVKSLDDLRQHLQGAVALEHATLLPYMYALYSIIPGTNDDAVGILTSVFVEEMLHMALAANLLNAVGGRPRIAEPGFVPSYPTSLPFSNESFQVPLARFSQESVATFMRIERPEEIDSPGESDHFETIGQFYRAVENALKRLCHSLGEANVFCGDPDRQITAETLGRIGRGHVVAVTDLATALAAVDEIEEQGEGLRHSEIWDGDRDMFHPERDEVAHYFRFDQLIRGRRYQRGDTPQSGPSGEVISVDWDGVYPMLDNPRPSDFPPGSVVREKLEQFQHAYSETLRVLQRALDGEPSKMNNAIDLMMELRDRARELAQTPSGDGATNVGPAFDFVEPSTPIVSDAQASISVS